MSDTTLQLEDVSASGVIYCRPVNYSKIEIQWKEPKESWQEVAIVRSVFGAPSTVNDGVTIYHSTLDGVVGKKVVYDQTLTGGRWYYYSLFFIVTPGEWKRTMTASTLLPKNYHHTEHLWGNVPPYYRWVDSTSDTHDLQRFLSLFGFELDTTREYVEQWQQVYSGDWCPQRLLHRLGENFDVPYEEGIGDIRYRSLLSRISFLYDLRGSGLGLEEMIEAASKYQCEITQGTNLMLLPDDSDFFLGTGNWAGIHPDTDPDFVVGSNVTVLPPDKVYVAISRSTGIPPGNMEPPPETGRGCMRLWTRQADETSSLMITCGDGIARFEADEDAEFRDEITPINAGIPVEPGTEYGFAAWFSMQVESPVQLILLWFSVEGEPENIIGVERGTATTPADPDTWVQYSVEGIAPANAAYLVPCIYFSSRLAGGTAFASPTVELCAAQVWVVA